MNTTNSLFAIWEQRIADFDPVPHLPADIENYLVQGGKVPDLSASARNYWFNYPKEIVDALEGEDALTAARMLRVLSELRRQGPVSLRYFGDEEEIDRDIRVCKLSERPFGETMELLVRTREDDYAVDKYYDLARIMLCYYPKETRTFADGTPQQKSAPKDDWPERMRCTIRVLCCLILAESDSGLTDKERAQYANMVLQGLELLPDKHKHEVMRRAWQLTPELKARTVTEVKENYDALCVVTLDTANNRKQSRNILEELGIPEYQHILIARSLRYSDDISGYFLKLYRSEPSQVHWVCQTLLDPKKSGKSHMAAIPIAALLCHMNDGAVELPIAEAALPPLLNKICPLITLPDSTSAWREVLACLDGTLSYEELLKQVCTPKRGAGRLSDFAEGLGALAIFSPRMTQLLKICVALFKDQDRCYGLDLIYSNVLVGLMDWCEMSEEKAVQQALAFGFPRETVYYDYTYGGGKDALSKPVLDLLRQYPKEALGFLSHPWLNDIDQTICWLRLIYGPYGETDYTPLCKELSNKSKKIRMAAVELLTPQESVARKPLEELLPSLKGDAVKLAKKLVRGWDNERKYGKGFSINSNEMAADFAKENLDTDNLNLIGWIPAELLNGVRFADLSAQVPVECLQFVLVEYMGLTEPARLSLCDEVAARIAPQDWEKVLSEIYEVWMNEGAEAKRKNILLPYCIYGSDSQVLGLRRQMEVWADASRGALAAFAAQAAALNGGSVALVMIDGIANKFPNNQVKKAARAAFSFAASALGVPEDVLSDRIVPTLGFTQAGEKTVDYGPRTFTVRLMPDFSLEITDNEKGKAVKSLPKPAANDDAQKAEAARKEFSELKKQMKTVVQTQKQRLEKALANGRSWTAEAWNTLFAQNPILHCFATGLVWCAAPTPGTESGTTPQTFRYLEDGTFTTAEEEEYILSPQNVIFLAHPSEMTTEEVAAWKQQLEDYEITQPLCQLDAPLAQLAPSDVRDGLLVRYEEKSSTVAKLTNLAKKQGMLRGEVLDAGGYTCFHWVDTFLKVGLQLNFEGMFMGQEYSEKVPLSPCIFYTLPENEVLSDNIPETRRLDPASLPKRYVCTVLAALDTLPEE